MYATKPSLLVLAVGLLVSTGTASGQADMGTAFKYQGELEHLGQLVSASCDFRLCLYDAATGGNLVADPLELPGVLVTDGRFTAMLDFGEDAFPGDARWLEIAVCCPSACPPQTLAPRQALTPAPHALRAKTGVGGPDALNVTTDDKVGIGTETPTGRLHVVGDVYAEGTVTSAGHIWLDGSTDSVVTDCRATGGMELRLGDVRALRLEAASPAQSPNLIGGHNANYAAANVVGATIGGGGDLSFANRVFDNYGTIGGGYGNVAGYFGPPFDPTLRAYCTVGGGTNNKAEGLWATVGGGEGNGAG